MICPFLSFKEERWRIVTITKLLSLLSLFSVATFSMMFFSAHKRNVIHHELNVDSVEKNNAQLKVFFISDIHRRKVDHRLLKKIDRDVDLVIIGGDLAEKNVPHKRIAENVQQLSRLGPVFYVWGNNDREVGEREIRKIMNRYQANILDNIDLPVPGHPLWGICGTDDPSCMKTEVEAALENVDQYENLIFVSHQPRIWQKVERYINPTIMFAGHTHGGQIRLGPYGLDEKGYYEIKDGTAKLISNGYGTTKIPLRLGAPSECHIVTLNYTK